MRDEAQGAPTLGRGRHLADATFAGDDGTADASVREVISEAAAGAVPVIAAARGLRAARLLSCVLAVLDESDHQGADTASHMAVVSMVNDAGDRGLLCFTGVDALLAWDPQARPVPALGRDVARAALDDGATAVVVDVAGPARLVLQGAALMALADLLDLAEVSARVQAALAPLTADGWADADVIDARGLDAGVDVIVRLSAPAGGHPDGRLLGDLARQAAEAISARPDIYGLVPGGLGVTTD